MSSPRATVSLEGWSGLHDWSTVRDDCKVFRKDSLVDKEEMLHAVQKNSSNAQRIAMK